jgi:hypothetical protein
VCTVLGRGWMERKGKERSTRPSRTYQCEPCQAAAVRRGEKRKGQCDRKELNSGNRVGRRLCGEERKALQLGEDGQVGQVHQEPPSVYHVRRRLDGEERKGKVNATVKNPPVCTVSGGGWMERKEKNRKGQRDCQELNSVNCVRRRL